MDKNILLPKALYYAVLNYQPSSLTRLNENFELIKIDSPLEDTPELLSVVDVLFAPLGYPTDQKKIDKCTTLKVIASNTTGHPHIDVDHARARNIQVVTLKDETSFLEHITPTAELTWGLIIALTRNIIPAIKSVNNGHWQRRPFGGFAMLSSMKLGVIGLGRLGKMVASYGIAANMEVSCFDPYVKRSNQQINHCETLEELVSESDIVSVHIPSEPETEKIFNQDVFSAFKTGSYFVNTSRGELVDQNALLQALMQGKLSGAAMDVFDGEFDPLFDITRHALWKYAQSANNLILTPHIGGSTVDAWEMTENLTITRILEALQRD